MSLQPFYKFLSWLSFLIFICFIGVFNVFADTFENIGHLSNYSDVLVEVSYTGSPLPLTKNDTYQLEQVEALNINISNYTFDSGTTYKIEISLPDQTLNYANSYTAIGTTTSNQTVNCSTYDISYDNIHYPNFTFKCNQDINHLNIRIINTNGNYIMSNGLFTWNYVYLRRAVIDDNTQDIIDNQNQNTQDIIDNQNQNTQDIIDNQNEIYKDCHQSYNLLENTASGVTNNGISYIINSDKSITINGTSTDFSTIIIKQNLVLSSGTYYIIPTGSADISLIGYNGSNWPFILNGSNRSFTLTNQVNFIQIYYQIPSGKTFNNYKLYPFISSKNITDYEQYGQNICVNRLDQQTNAINGLNDSLNDDDTDGATSEASEFFSDFNTNTFGLTSIITAPLNLIQSLTSKTCSPLHLPLPYLTNKYLDLPCMSSIYSQHFGTFFTLYQTITYGIIAYWVCVRIFNHVKDFKNPEHDEIEVVDL